MENKERSSGQSMWGERAQGSSSFERKYPLPSRPKKPEVKKTETKKEVSSLGVFGKQGFLDKGFLTGKLEGRQDFYTDSNIKMGREQRKKFAEKLKEWLPKGKNTFNIGDVKIVEKKLIEEEFKVKGTPKEFEIKRERAALKKLFDLK